jgi:hypothetical protein
VQCFGSGSAFDGRLDPYSEYGSRSRRPIKIAKKYGKTVSKRQIMSHKKGKKQCNWYKMGKCALTSLKVKALPAPQ